MSSLATNVEKQTKPSVPIDLSKFLLSGYTDPGRSDRKRATPRNDLRALRTYAIEQKVKPRYEG